MPVTTISIIAIILPYKIGLQIYLISLLGSSGDLYMSIWLCKLENKEKIIDKSYGFNVVKQKNAMFWKMLT